MDAKELRALLDETVAPVAAQVAALAATVDKLKGGTLDAASVAPMIEPHARALHACADAMSAAGVGNDPRNGHVIQLHRMADNMMAEAHMGRVPTIYRDHEYPWSASARGHVPVEDPKVKELNGKVESLTAALATKDDAVAALGTKVKDLEAAAARNSPEPGRKTLPPAISAMMARAGIELPDAVDGKVSIAKIDEVLGKTTFDATQRMQFKTELRNAGLLN